MSKSQTRLRNLARASAVLVLASSGIAASGQTFTDLYDFNVGGPTSPLFLASSGTLIGEGAINNESAVFILSPPSTAGGKWVLNTLANSMDFDPDNGIAPSGGSLFTAAHGGAGAILEVSPPAEGKLPWAATVLFTFTDATTGNEPNQLLVSSGNLFGTALLGGTSNMGTAFELSPPAAGSTIWTEQTIHTFTGAPLDGYDPSGPLALGPGGILYGTTLGGGTSDLGTVFSLSPPVSQGGAWTESIIYNCAPGSASPDAGVVLGKNGVLYGTTGGTAPGYRNNYNGTVFALYPPVQPGSSWTYQTLYAFTGKPDGHGPTGTIAMDENGVLYGATLQGGTFNRGMVYQLTPPGTEGGEWTETILHNFKASDAYAPYFGVTVSPNGHVIYGNTSYGGAYGDGIIYQIVK